MKTTLPLRLALRELRNGVAGFKLFLACLILGVAVIATVSSLSQMLSDSLQRDAKSLLGGDVEISLSGRKISANEEARLAALGKMSTITEMRAMASNGDNTLLVELKSIDAHYPLYGTITLDPPQPLSKALAGNGIILEKDILLRLGLKLHDTLRLGSKDFRVNAIITREPDRIVSSFTLGPRIMMSHENMQQTGLLLPGSLIRYRYRLALLPSLGAEEAKQTLMAEFPESGWQVRTYREANPTVKNFLSRLTVFMTLTGLTSLLCAGIGMAESVSAYMNRKLAVIATLKSLGSPQKLVFMTYVIQLLIISLIGISGGIVLGAALSLAAASGVERIFQLTLTSTIYPSRLLIAGSFGLLTVCTFSLWNLGKAMAVSPTILFRGTMPLNAFPPRPIQYVNLLLALLLATLIIVTSTDMKLAASFIIGASLSLALYILFALVIKKLIAQLHPSLPLLRLGLANLHRPGASTVPVIIAMGLGLTVLVTLLLVERNFQRQLQTTLPETAPTYFFIDIQPDQLEPFLKVLNNTKGISHTETVPMVRGRITHLNHIKVDENAIPEEARWAIRSDRGLTYAATKPALAEISAGTWWEEDYRGKPLISFDAKLAKNMGLKLGDTITFNIMGNPIEATIANLRTIDYSSMQINFATIFSPGVLENAPHSYLATTKAAHETAEQQVIRTIIRNFPNITAVNIKSTLRTVEESLHKIATAIQAVGIVTLLSALLVLAGTLAAAEEKRIYHTVLLKVLGASRRKILTLLLIEFSILGVASALISLAVGSVAAYATLRFLNLTQMQLFTNIILISVGSSILIITIMGLIGNIRAFSIRPARFLRDADSL
jgi:putative ABC transport system permease protein